jgi:hypothetical protein
LKRGKKIKKSSTEWYLNLFHSFSEDTESRKICSDIYDEAYSYYEPKIRNKEISIEKERVALESKAGKYKGFVTNFNMQLMIIPFASVLTALIQFIGTTVQAKYSALVSLVFSSLTFIYLIREISKDNSNQKELVYNICLKVLEDIEKQIKSENERLVANGEVAAAIQKLDENLNKRISDLAAGISISDAFTTANSVFTAIKFVRSVFKGKR